jgi:hypothetical protein
MGIEYSFLADWLTKFHTSTPLIQALWLIAMAGTLCAFAFCFSWCVRGVVFAIAQKRPKEPKEPSGQVLYSVAKMEDGELRVFRHVPDLAEIHHEALGLLTRRDRGAMPTDQPREAATRTEVA